MLVFSKLYALYDDFLKHILVMITFSFINFSGVTNFITDKCN